MRLAILLCFLCVIASRLLGVNVGDSREAVVKELGEPPGRMAVGTSEVLHFPKIGRITLKNGAVTEIDRSILNRPAAPIAQLATPPPNDGVGDEALSLIEGPQNMKFKKVEKSSIDNRNYIQMQQGEPVKMKYTNAWDAAADARRAELELRIEPIDFLPHDVIPGRVVLLVGVVHGLAYLTFTVLTLPIAFKVLDIFAPSRSAFGIAAVDALVFSAAFSVMVFFSGASIEKTPIREYLFTAIAITVPTLTYMINRASEVRDWAAAIRAALAASVSIAGLFYGFIRILPASRISAWIL